MALTTELDVPEIGDPALVDSFHERVQELRGQGVWLARSPTSLVVIEHEAVHDLLRHPGLVQLGIRIYELQGVTEGEGHDRFARNILCLEGEAHARIRSLVARAFTPRAVAGFRPLMREWVDDRAVALGERGGGDVMADLVDEYPVAMICALVGAPAEDWPRFVAWAEDIFRVFQFTLATDLPLVEAAGRDLEEYVRTLAGQRRGQPGNDLLSTLLQIEEEGDRLTEQELCDIVATVILGGTDTTRNQLGLGLKLLADHPAHWAKLVEDPTGVPAMVEEILRLEPTAVGTPRIATSDVTYRGVTLPAGTVLLLAAAAANRDPAAVQCPMAFDAEADRGSWQPSTFGGGPHYCLGASLARAELQEALGVLVRRWRRIEPTGVPEMKPVIGIYGPRTLPLRVEPI
jgi:cytochrome P450